MKKFIAGVIVGALVATGTSVYAASQITGMFADFNVLVNGNKVSLEQEPLVVDGSTYLKVREISEMLGYEVQYENVSRTISLSNDGKKYLTNDDSGKGELMEEKSVVEGKYIKDLATKYSEDGKLNAEKIKTAIENGILDVNSQDEETGDSLFILAIKENNFPVYEVLKYRGVDPELANREGKTPLHIAVIENNDFFYGELTNYFEVKTKIKDSDGKMPIDYADKTSSTFRSLRMYDE
ncbi:stalk domain-containing protein [Paenibacillus sp. J2TS4]|uniref:stalk domain-containing protein n=1 Tax=Paenibacillus sp. J2TS4 TaxID=2807194 RepID=UPI001B1A54A7|nr:stalk domain-containing protein [Paenibacillus sp. J2TS4]GIP32601.1 hypothetical protein J2TS4_18110 [Paenibacillus sp. J2TS4]